MKNHFLQDATKEEHTGSGGGEGKSFKVLDVRVKELNWQYSNLD